MRRVPPKFMNTRFLHLLAAGALILVPSLRAQEGGPSKEAIAQLLKRPDKGVAPIIIPAGARTEADVDKEQAAWFDRVLVQPGLARLALRKDVAWAEEAAQFLKKAPAFTMTLRVIIVPEEVMESAKKLVKAGCDEPSAMLLAGMIGRRSGMDWRFIWDCSTQSIKGWEADPKTLAVLYFQSDAMLAWAWERSGRKKECEEMEKKALIQLGRMAADGSFKAGEEELFFRQILKEESLLAKHTTEFRDLAAKIELPEWARLTTLGCAEERAAWSARGDGWASSVSEKEWKGFAEHLEKSRDALTRAWKANPKSPMAAAKMIAVTMGGAGVKGEAERVWFDRAIAAQCDYSPAYAAMMSAYRPRWSGSHELMLAFGKACANTNRYDTDIPTNFTQACNDIVSEIGDWRAFYRRPEVAGPLLTVSEGWLKEPTRAHERRMRLSFLALNAWLTGDTGKAAAGLKQLGAPLHVSAADKLGSYRATEREFREEVALANSKIAADFARADGLYKSGKIAEAAALFRKIEPSAPDEAGEGVRERLQIIDIEQGLAKGDWVKLPVAPGLRGWLQRGGIWSGEADGTLVNKGNDWRSAMIHRARVGNEFEMRLEFSVEAKEKCCRRCDIIFGWHAGFQEPMNMAIYGQPGKFPAEARFDTTYMPPPKEKMKGIPYLDKNSLFLHCSGGKLTFTVNGKDAYTDYRPAGMVMGPEDGQVGVGSTRWCIMNTTRISNIEVRRLITETGKPR